MALLEEGTVPFAAQAVPFADIIKSGKIPHHFLESEYLTQQFVERLVHYVLSVPQGTFSMPELGKVLERIDPSFQVFFFQRLKENSPESLKQFASLYYGFMAEFHPLLFT